MNNYFLSMKKAIVLLNICLLGCLWSCSKSETMPSITLNSGSTSAITMDAAASSKTISFNSNVSWTATSSASWLKVSPSSGTSGDASITITQDENLDYKERTATITIT